jgi:hypothetical protein
LEPTSIGQSKRSNHPGIVVPPLIVMGIVGAGGKTYLICDNREEYCGKERSKSDQPAGVSPSPCKKINAPRYFEAPREAAADAADVDIANAVVVVVDDDDDDDVITKRKPRRRNNVVIH